MINAVALMSLFGTGIIYSLIGALKLELARELAIDDQKVGALISALMLSSFIVILIVGPLVDLIGHKPITILGFFMGFAAMVLLFSVKSYTLAVLSCVFLGVGGICLNTVGNTLLPIIFFDGANPPAALNVGTAFYGIGAVITPLFIGMFSTRVGYKVAGSILAIVILIPVSFSMVAAYPTIAENFLLSRAIHLLTDAVIISSGIAFFCYLGIEVSMSSWITTYGDYMGFSEKSASMILGSFWMSLIISRLIASTFITPETGTETLIVLTILSFFVIGLMSILQNKTAAVVIIILTGFIFGPIFPTIIGIALSNTEPSLHGSAFAIVFSFGLLGASLIPLLIGIFSKTKTIQEGFRIAMIVTLVLFSMTLMMKGA